MDGRQRDIFFHCCLSLFFFSLIPILLVFLLCSLFVTLPPNVSFFFLIHFSQTKYLLRSLDQRRWRWPAAVAEEASLACPAALPVLSAYPSAVQVYGRRRAAGAGLLFPAVGVPPASASWAKATQTPASLTRMVGTEILAYPFPNLNILLPSQCPHRLQVPLSLLSKLPPVIWNTSQSQTEQITLTMVYRDYHDPLLSFVFRVKSKALSFTHVLWLHCPIKLLDFPTVG